MGLCGCFLQGEGAGSGIAVAWLPQAGCAIAGSRRANGADRQANLYDGPALSLALSFSCETRTMDRHYTRRGLFQITPPDRAFKATVSRPPPEFIGSLNAFAPARCGDGTHNRIRLSKTDVCNTPRSADLKVIERRRIGIANTDSHRSRSDVRTILIGCGSQRRAIDHQSHYVAAPSHL